jgi:hypothetical protein
MKTSRRLLFGTFLVILAAPVALVAFSRVNGTGMRELPVPERTPPAELAALRDFAAINIAGDFRLEIVQADTYSIAYTPLQDNRGNFTASVIDGTLTVEGFGNRTEFAQGSVRIGLPDLDALEAGYVTMIAIRNFTGDTLDVSVDFTEELVLENNRLDSLQLDLQRAGLVEMRGNTFGTSRVTHFGLTLTTD